MKEKRIKFYIMVFMSVGMQLDLSNERVNDVHSLFQNLEKIGAQLRYIYTLFHRVHSLENMIHLFILIWTER